MDEWDRLEELHPIDYFEYLLNDYANGEFVEYFKTYNNLMWRLYSTDYRWHNLFDENRAIDGLGIRELYFADRHLGDEYTMEDIFHDSPCSVLEMLLALSVRIESQITGEPGNEHPEKWFWTMLNNLNLIGYTDLYFIPESVDSILNNWMDGKISRNGNGGLFPVKQSHVDQRELDVWFQLNSYLMEIRPLKNIFD